MSNINKFEINRLKKMVLLYISIGEDDADENSVDEAITLMKPLPKFKNFSKEVLDDISNEIKAGLNSLRR